MSVQLRGAVRAFSFNKVSWRYVLALARYSEWEPAETLLPTDEGEKPDRDDRDGGYEPSGARRCVTAEDAARLADALEQCLPNLSDRDLVGPKLPPTEVGGVFVESFKPTDDVTPTEWFSGEAGPQYLRQFIAFCRQGEFSIG